MTRDELIVQHDDAMARCASMTQHEEDTAKALWSTVHDLRNPISSIIGSCEYLSEYSPENLEPEQREMLSAIEASARTLLGLSAKLHELCGVGGRSALDGAATLGEDDLPALNGSSDANS